MGKTVRLRGFRAAVITLILAVTVAALVAQSVVDPTVAEFDPSPEHHDVASDGTPFVQSYSLALHVAGQSTPFETVNLGKPVPDFDGKIRVSFLNLLSAVPASGVTYEARVWAVGSGGTAASNLSNPFSFSSLCSPHLNASVMSVPASGGTGTVGLSVNAGCNWTTTSSAAWLTITSGASGSGSGTIAFDVAANTNSAARTGTITAAGQSFTVSQAGVACTYGLSPTSTSVTSAGGSVALTMTTAGACSWNASSNSSWLTITGGGSGSGGGTITVDIAANTGSTSRTGTVTAGGKTFTVTQAAASCSYSLASTAHSVPAGGASGSFVVNAGGSCTWTAVSGASWLTLTSGASGSGSGTVAYVAAANTTASPRSGTITAAGHVFTVTQAAAPCTYALSASSASIPAAGGSSSVVLTTGGTCNWTATSGAAWLSVTNGTSGAGNTTVAFSATPNPNATPRSGTITIGGQTLTVTQAAAACTYALSVPSASIPAGGGSSSVVLTTGGTCNWTATSSAAWLSVTNGTSGTGSTTVAFSAMPNPSDTPRSGTITTGGQTLTVTQAAAACTYALAPSTGAVSAAGGTGSISLMTGASCAWTASANEDWLTVVSGADGSGNGSISYLAAANPASAARSGSITAGGQTFTVSQTGVSCSHALVPASRSVPAEGASGTVMVTGTVDCSWTSQSSAAWITVTAGASGVGGTSFNYTVSPNPGGARTGTVTAGGQTFTVEQAGAPCTYTLAQANQLVHAAGGQATIGLTTGSACTWTATSSVEWITPLNASGAGSSAVGYRVEPNPDSVSRTGIITIGGMGFTVSQFGASCTFTLDSTSLSLSAAGGTGTVSISTGSTCFSGASSQVPWIMITSGGSGAGPRTVGFSVAPNPGTGERIGTLTIAGQVFTVTQAAGAGCTYAVAPTSQLVAAAGGTASVGITTGAACGWVSSSDVTWMTVTTGASGTGSGTVGYTVAPNTSGAYRAGTLTIGGQRFSVSQAGVGCTFGLDQTSLTMPAAGGTGTVSLTAPSGCFWLASSNVAWMTITSGTSGTGSRTFTFTVAANTAAGSRTGTLVIAGKTFTVTQAGQ